MLEKLPYKIYKRTLRTGSYMYYARFLLPSGKYTSGRSLDTTNRKEAEIKAFQLMNSGSPVKRRNQKLKEFSKDFFDWDGEWSLSRRSAGKAHSLLNCKKYTQLTENHIIRLLGDRMLDDIDTTTVRWLRNQLYKEGRAGSSINKIIGCLKQILLYADELGLLRRLPRFERASLNQEESGILTNEEARTLFSQEWNTDIRHYTINLLAYSTGFRLGELLGLKISNVNFKTGYVTIYGNWNSEQNIFKHRTKNGQPQRSVPVPSGVLLKLKELIEQHPYGKQSSFLFYAFTEDQPMDERSIRRELYRALDLILGIDKDLRLQRHLVFHSSRHFFNSMLIESKIPLQKIQRLTGHLSASMTQRYYHLDSLEDVENVTETMFQDVIPFNRGA